jgi:hypothetical protein
MREGVMALRSIFGVHLGLRKRQAGGVDGGHLGASTQVLCLLEKEENGQICTKAPGFGGFSGIKKNRTCFV